MKIGLVYDLRDDYRAWGWDEEAIAEFDNIQTIEALETALVELGYQPERIGNIHALVPQLAAGRRWDAVFNIAEGAFGLGREAQVPALLDAYQIPYTFSGPVVMGLTLDKALTKRVIRDAGLATAPFEVVREISDIQKVDLTYPLFVKPIGEGTGKGVSAASRVTSEKEFEAQCVSLLTRFRQPVLVETFLSGREFTVGLLGSGRHTEVLGILEIVLREGAELWGHSYKNKEECETLVDYVLVSDKQAIAAAELARKAWQVLGALDAGRVDIRMDKKGVPCFIEINPLSGLHPTHSDLPLLATKCGMPFQQLIGRIMEACLARYHLTSKTVSPVRHTVSL